MTTFCSLRSFVAAPLAGAIVLAAGLALAQAAEPAKPAAPAPATPAAAPAEASDAALAQIDKFIAEQKIDRASAGWKTHLPKPPRLTFTKSKTYLWELETNHGRMTIQLMPDVAPQHVSSTIYLTRLGFYDKLSFHRVIAGFMAQGGDPLGNGTGGPGYEYNGEFDSTVKLDRKGRLAMANAGPGTDGSQFFITFTSTEYLNGKHTVFGQIKDGMNTLDELEKRGSRGGTPSEPLEILRASIAVN